MQPTPSPTPLLEQRRRMLANFLRATRYGVGGVVVLLGLMAVFLLKH